MRHGGIVTGMRLVLDTDPQILTVRRYGAGEIEVAGRVLRAPCILSPAQLIVDWEVGTAANLDDAALAPLLALRPAVVLVGSGVLVAGSTPAASALRRSLAARGVALELMSLGAACRTYNVLAQERREVVAGLFP
jgi:uncharacterized protein